MLFLKELILSFRANDATCFSFIFHSFVIILYLLIYIHTHQVFTFGLCGLNKASQIKLLVDENEVKFKQKKNVSNFLFYF
jgi:hypothetical protein